METSIVVVEYNRFITGNFSISQHVTTGNLLIYIAELSLCLVALPFNLMFMFVLLSTSCLHKNLRILLVSTCFANTGYCFSRFLVLTPLVVAYFFNVEISSVEYCWAAKSFHHVMVTAPGLTFFVVIFERIIATYWYQTYESRSCYQSGYILTAVQWIFAVIVVVSNQIDVAGTARPYSRLPCQMEYTTGRCLVALVCTLCVINTISVIGFSKVYKYNKKLFKQRSWRLKKLSETYQVSENVRSIKLLFPILGVMLVSSIVGLCLIALNGIVYLAVNETEANERAEIMIAIVGKGSEITQIYDVVTVISKIAFCYAIRSHPLLYRRWYSMFCPTKVSTGEAPALKSIEGTQLKFSNLEETEHHFESLTTMWK